jgi:hypothetical protein
MEDERERFNFKNSVNGTTRRKSNTTITKKCLQLIETTVIAFVYHRTFDSIAFKW